MSRQAKTPRISAKFLGGVASAENLTGSSILLEVIQDEQVVKILIDIGLVQSGQNFLEKNKEILKHLDPKNLRAIILTHSHIDHIGRLPLLVKNGFKGSVYCTSATSKLLKVMLEDSAKIQMNDFTSQVKRHSKQVKAKGLSHDRLSLGNYDRKMRKIKDNNFHPPKKEPLYDLADVKKSCDLVKNRGYAYRTWIWVAKNISLKFYPSGHILGGAVCVIKIKTKNKEIYLGFNGDLGRRDGIILPPPEVPEEAINYWFTESNYGGKVHPERTDEIMELLSVVKRTITENGKIIIPSFALERTQEIIYLLSYYMQTGEIPRIKMYLDSPLATRLTTVYSSNWRKGMFRGQNRLKFNPFDPQENQFLEIVQSGQDSNKLISSSGPYIVIAGSGMCDAGRVRNHLRSELGHQKTNVCLVGYMAKNTLGRRLKDHKPIRMNNMPIDVKANIISFDSFSAHADSPFLVDYSKAIISHSHNQTKIVFFIHGEEEHAMKLRWELHQALLDFDNKIPKLIIPKLEDKQRIE